MITREQIPQVVGHPVLDAQGKKIGDAKHMYLDDATGDPEWVTVKTGLFGNSETFVPTRAARIVQDHVEVPYEKDQVKGAPNVDVDSGGHLSAEEERHLYRYYGLETKSGAGPGMGTAAAGGAAGAAAGGRAAAGTGTAEPGTAETEAGRAPGGPAGAGTGQASYAVSGTGRAERTAPDTGAEDLGEAMTRSEEEIHVRVERQESGTARLRRYVDVEEVEQTVPIVREEVRLEREPLSGREAGRIGDINEAERVVTLHEDKAIVETEVVPKERVRMLVEEHTEQKKVRGRVRKERIEADMIGPDKGTREARSDRQGRNKPMR